MTNPTMSNWPERFAPVDDVIDRALIEKRLVGTVVLVARDTQLIYARAAGLANRERAQPMTVDTVFRLASVTKPIVSAAAMVLVARGQLELDAAIERWLPEFRPRLADGRAARITARQLLSHTAGLGYRFNEPDAHGPYARAGVSDGLDASGIDLAENLRRIASVPLLYEPGTSWAYSVATDVLGALVERVHGAPLAVAIRDLVTGPLEMTETAFTASDAARVATVYVNDAPAPHLLREGETVSSGEGTIGIRFSPARIFDRDAFASGGAGMAGTARDVLRLLEALRDGASGLLPAECIEEMSRDQTHGFELPDAPGFGFGLGFSVLRDRVRAQSPESNGTWRWGGAYGHSWFVDRAERLTVVAMTNTIYEGTSGAFVYDLRDAVYRALRAAR